jgi:hypothetical protein
VKQRHEEPWRVASEHRSFLQKAAVNRISAAEFEGARSIPYFEGESYR